jgi:hypothetical protein
VRKTREIAGGIIKRSWDAPPIDADSEMHAPEIATELRALRPFEDGYLDKVAVAMKFWPGGKIVRKREHYLSDV